MNPSTAAATVIVDELIRNGVTHFVLSPGSRNAPLSVAIFAAAKSGRATLHVRIDERSAGFLALGLSKGMGYGPRRGGRAAIVCTSGTAVANLHPAVLEAVHSGEPLVLLTADRPAELVGSGANQTTVQSGVFGPQVSTVDFPIAERRAGQNATWRGILCRVLIDGADKPVHLNVPFREPLLPDSDVAGKPDLDAAGDAAEGADALRDWPESLAGREGGVPWTRWRQTLATDTAGGAATDAGGDSGGVELLRELPARTLVIVGDAPWSAASAAGEVARRMDWPLLVEPPGVGPRHALSGASLMINAVTELPDGLKPDAVLVVGRPTLSRGTGRLLRSVSRVHLVCTPRHWADAQYVASSAVPYLGVAAVHHLAADGAIDEHTDAQWTASWRKANASVADAVRCWLADQPWPTGATVARDLLAALPSRAVLFMGSSNAIRDIDLVAERRGDLIVLANRGLAGI
ncbi:MAG: 2-succinyl-5-enolpyruvyl-6-hydroxy-3-cyclohexene-1-carboxylic-acid synthase, partial [Sciscionella sp.]|nr:2-succinyl-5-enolpyruvyl-6-hydroxy-3-cyclohexene-1-carboxylic-acid synthase [Sciscionella sp.]